MSRQRLAILITAILGCLATFLPWIKGPIIGSLDGTRGDGWITFGLFIIPILIAAIGNTSAALNTAQLLGTIIPAVLAVGIGMWKIADFKKIMKSEGDEYNEFMGDLSNAFSIGNGIYLLIIAGVLLIILALTVKNKPGLSG